MTRRSTSAVKTPRAESIAYVASKNQSGMSWATSENSRIGNAPRRKIGHRPRPVSSSAHNNTESGNQKGDARAWLKDMP